MTPQPRTLPWLAAGLGAAGLLAASAMAQPGPGATEAPDVEPPTPSASATAGPPEPTESTASAADSAAAVPAAPARDFDEPLTSHVPMANSDVEMAVTTIGIHAPVAAVRRIVQSYSKYDTIFPYVQQSRIVGRSEGNTDVYLRVPILHGMVHVWGKARFSKPRTVDGIEVISAELLEGSLLAWQARWELQPCGDTRTLLTLRLFLELDVPVPDSLVTQELMRVAGKTVRAVREQAECPPTTP